MEMTVKEVIPVLTLLGALLVFYTRVFNNFFMSIIKMNYKEVPGKQTMFEITIQWVGYIGYIAYLIISAIVIIKDSKNGVINLKDIRNLATLIVNTVASIAIIAMIRIFKYLYKVFKKKLKGEILILKNRIEMLNKINIYIFIVSTILSLVIVFKETIYSITIENGTYFLFKGYAKNQLIITYSIFAVIFGTALLISINLKEIIKALKNTNLYVIYFAKEKIYSNCFLEFKEYYLVIENGNERYVNKSKVNEIRKIKSRIISN